MKKEMRDQLKKAFVLYNQANRLYDAITEITTPMMKEIAERNDKEEMIEFIGSTPCSFTRAEMRGHYKNQFPWGNEEQDKMATYHHDILKEIRNEQEFSFDFKNKRTMEFLCWIDRILYLGDFLEELKEYGMDDDAIIYLRFTYNNKSLSIIQLYQDHINDDDMKKWFDAWLEIQWKKWIKLNNYPC